MRLKTFLIAGATSLILVLIILRHHIRDLANIVRTYGTFYHHLSQHPDIIFRYEPSSDDASSPIDPDTVEDVFVARPVPKIIHQIFLTHDPQRPDDHSNSSLSAYLPARESCIAMHPHWRHLLWTDDNATDFISTHYPSLLPHYTTYPQNIQRANILRYALLHHFGGVYLDLDVTCLVALDTSLSDPTLPLSSSSSSSSPSLTNLPFLSPAAHPAGVNNAFILAQPGHRFLKFLLDRVPSRNLKWGLPYVENMLSTGCMFFSNMWMAYALRLARAERVDPRDRVYVLAMADGSLEGQMLRGKITTPLFAHGGASSWHGWDAAAIVILGNHYRLFVAAGIVGFVVMMLIGWRLFTTPRAAATAAIASRRRRNIFSSLLNRLGLRRMDPWHGQWNDEEQALMKEGSA